mgnify:CR=1 FL=1
MSHVSHVDSLPTCVALELLCYLDVQSLYSISLTSVYFSQLVIDNQLPWIQHFVDASPLMREILKSSETGSRFRYEFDADVVGYRASLKLMGIKCRIPAPASICPTFLLKPNDEANISAYSPFRFHAVSTHVSDKLDLYQWSSKITLYYYGGMVGLGDRSLRANEHFPDLTALNHQNMKGFADFGELFPPSSPSSVSGISRMLSSLRSSPPQSDPTLGSDFYQPFVTPYVYSASDTSDEKTGCGRRKITHVDLRPRTVAYYEVTIHRYDLISDLIPDSDRDGSFTNPFLQEMDQVMVARFGGMGIKECIAVGLANDIFDCERKMPGWDEHSYGLHSDDGKFFHGSSNSDSSTMTTPFGEGDTIGCGILYRYDDVLDPTIERAVGRDASDLSGTSSRIFFTRNGKLIGIAPMIEKKCSTATFYPCIGVDSKLPISVNFGATEFVYDLKGEMVDPMSKTEGQRVAKHRERRRKRETQAAIAATSSFNQRIVERIRSLSIDLKSSSSSLATQEEAN